MSSAPAAARAVSRLVKQGMRCSAAAYLTTHRLTIGARVGGPAGADTYSIGQVLDAMVLRARELGLERRKPRRGVEDAPDLDALAGAVRRTLAALRVGRFRLAR